MSYSAELVQRSVMVAGEPREYLLASPAGTPTGIVVCLHGRGMAARWQPRFSGMDRLARDEGAVVVFPQGSVRVDRQGYSWAHETDLPYLAFVIEAVRVEFASAESGVCLCGMSAGARMASFYAAARAGDVSVLGAVAGLRPPQVVPARPVRVVAFHGLADRALPYEGGRGSRWTRVVIEHQDRRAKVSHRNDARWGEGVADAARAWAVANGVEAMLTDSRVSPTLRKTSYGEGTAGEVTLWTSRDAGHTWPGHPGGPLMRLFLGRTSSELDATEEIWWFFSRNR